MRIYPVVVAAVLLLAPIVGATVVGADAGAAQVTTTQSGVSIQLGGPTEANYLDQMEELVNESGVEPRANAFLLVKGERQWVVFTDEEVETGAADVVGTLALPATASSTGAIFATDVSVSQDGQKVALDDVRDNPGQYDSQLVTVDANYSQIAYLADSGSVVSKTVGGIVGGQTIGTGGEIGASAADTVLDLSQSNDRLAAAWSRVQRGDTGVPTTGYGETRWQSSGAATVDLVVFETGGEATFILADAEFDSTRLDSVGEIRERGDELAGEVVTVETQGVGARLSVKQSLLQVAKCAPESVTTPAGCIPVPVDSVVHGGVLFDSVPSSLGDAVIYAGVSNREQSDAIAPERGSYEVTGRVVQAESLGGFPDGYALLVYDMERTGDLAIGDAAREQAAALRGEVQGEIRAQLNASVGEEPATATPAAGTSTPSGGASTASQSATTPAPTQTATKTPPAVSTIVVESATVVNDDIITGEEFVVEATVANTGRAAGERTIWLSVGGGDVENRRVSLAAGESETIRFTTLVDTTSPQLVEVGDESAGVVRAASGSPLSEVGVSEGMAAIGFGFGGAVFVLSSLGIELFRGVKSWRGGDVTTGQRPAVVLLALGGASLVGSGLITTAELGTLALLIGGGLLVMLVLALLGQSIYREL